jgi:hypothetical protein
MKNDKMFDKFQHFITVIYVIKNNNIEQLKKSVQSNLTGGDFKAVCM